jgi:hypothetical protein
MTVSAVEFYVQSLLDAQTVLGADDLGPTQAYVIPPPVMNLMPSPQIFVWGGKYAEERHTMPRLYGQKRVKYALTLWVQLATSNEDLNNDFDLVIQTIQRILRTVSIPISLTDSQTGETSVLQTIGEEMSVQHPPPMTSADQRMLLHNATVTVVATEEFTA